MINIGRSAFCVASLLLRRRLGRELVGFGVMVDILISLIVLVAVLLTARGFMSGTVLGDLLAIPIVMPAIVVFAGTVGLWGIRVIGLLPGLGPLRDDEAEDGFTGHSAELWQQHLKVNNEWTILEQMEPAVLALVGVVLLTLPLTRFAGLFLIIASVAVATQSKRDRVANENAPERYEGFVVVEPPRMITSVHTTRRQIQIDAPQELRRLLDAETNERIDLYATEEQEEIRHEPEPTPPRRVENTAGQPDVTPRGRISAPACAMLTPFLLIAVVTMGIYVAVGDPLGAYKLAPGRFLAVAESWQTGLSVVGLTQPADEHGEGELVEVLLGQVDPNALATLADARTERIRTEAAVAVHRFAAALNDVRDNAEATLGFSISLEATPPAFEHLLLRHEDVAATWAELLTLDQALGQSCDDAMALLEGGGSVESVHFLELRDTAAGWERSTRQITDLAARLRAMSGTD